MKEFTGLKLNHDNFTGFNLKFLHERDEIYFDVNQDMPDDILPVVQFDEATDKAVSSLEQGQYTTQSLNDKFAVEWAYTVPNELSLSKSHHDIEYRINDSSRSRLRSNSISQLVKQSVDGLFNGKKIISPGEINFKHLKILKDKKE